MNPAGQALVALETKLFTAANDREPLKMHCCGAQGELFPQRKRFSEVPASRGSLQRKGFTLIELLVVISIIALLVSILLPSLGKAKMLAKQVTCRGNLHAIGIGWIMYREDHPGFIPNAVHLPVPPLEADEVSITDVIAPPYAPAKAWECPADDVNYFNDYGTSYMYLPQIDTLQDVAGLGNLNAALLVFEELSEEHPDKWAIISDAESFHPSVDDPDRRMTLYHDGHVDWLLDEAEVSELQKAIK